MKILFVSDSISQPTGLTHVCVKIMTYLKRLDPSIEMAHLTITGETPNLNKAVAIHGKEFLKDMGSSFKVYEANVMKPNTLIQFDRAVSEFRPDIVFTNHDPWYCDFIKLSSLRCTFLWYYYATIEANEYPETIHKQIAPNQYADISLKDIYCDADMVIPVTKMGHHVLSKFGAKVTEPVYHGIEPSEEITFTLSKQDVFGVTDDTFVFMTAGTNAERKMVSRVIESFAKFLDLAEENGKDRKKFVLYLHVDIHTPQGGTDILSMVNKLHIADSVRVIDSLRINIGEERRKLLIKYKMADAFISLPGGEGFGLCFLEAMLQGKPVIYSDHGGHVEFCSEVSPFKVRSAMYHYAKNMAIMWGVADSDAAAEQMLRVVTDRELTQNVSRKSQEYARTQTWASKVCTIHNLIKDHVSTIQGKRLTILGSQIRRLI